MRMRSSFRLLAAVQRNGSQFLEPGAPTGLTGLQTSGSPRRSLILIYNKTLDKLKQFPDHSVYRQSTEALTRHRMKIVESVKPAGLSEWQSKVQNVVEKNPGIYTKVPTQSGNGSEYNIVWRTTDIVNEDGSVESIAVRDSEAANGKEIDAGASRASRKQQIEASSEKGDAAEEDADTQAQRIKSTMEERAKAKAGRTGSSSDSIVSTGFEETNIEPEPPLTADQVGEIESKINAGLIEEVIEVAEAEQKLIDVMFKSQIWEDLEERPVEGQWTYNERDRHTAGTGTGQ